MKKRILLLGFISLLSFKGIQYYFYFFGSNTLKSDYLYIYKEDTYEEVLKKITPFLKNKKSFDWIAKKKNYPNKIKKGKYFIPLGISNLKLVNKLRAGDQTEVKLQFGAENTLRDFILKVSSQLEMSAKSLEKAILNPKFLKKNHSNKETIKQIFIPNTYHVYWTITPENLLKILEKEYHKYWNEEKLKKAKTLGLSPLEVSILASIVQKETSKVDEMPKIAGLYLNRLKKNWKLQADPTVVHAIELLNKEKKIERLYYKHLKISSKYNTYLYFGLPPAPICHAEIPALEAVLNPDSHSYYYIVASAKNIGYHEFSKTALEHEKKRKSYLKWLEKNNFTQKKINLAENKKPK